MSSSKHLARTSALTALGWNEGELRVGGIPVAQLVQQFGSPLYVYDSGVVRRHIQAVTQALGSRVRTLFSLKANPNAAIAALARRAGAGAEVASAGELCVAQMAGFDGTDIQFAGPGKSDLDLDRALESKVDRIHLESETEYERLLSRRAAEGTRVGIRVNPGTTPDGARLRMSDPSARFGIDERRVASLIQRIQADRVCSVAGLHLHSGSQSFQPQSLAANAHHLIRLAEDVERDTGARMDGLNFGGGFGWPTYDDDGEALDLRETGALFQDAIRRDSDPDRSYFVELGRYLTAPAGVYLSRVIDLKRSGGHLHAILDGGLHHHSAAAGVAPGSRRRFAIVHSDDPVPSSPQAVMLGGPLCTPNDRFGRHVPLAPLKVGDVVAVLNSGAYGLTYSNTRFLSHPAPAEVLVDDGSASVVRDRGVPEDAIRDQRFPER